MPITGSQTAPTIARLAKMRIGASRLAYLGYLTIAIGAADRTREARVGTVSIHDVLNDTPNTCTFVCNAPAPTTGQGIQIIRKNATIFAGAVDRVDERYEGDDPANRAFDITAQDQTRFFTRRLVSQHYAEQSATPIAQDIAANTKFGAVFSIAGIAAGLPVLSGGIDFLDENRAECFSKIAQRIGGYWYIDYANVVHLFVSEASETPDALTPTTATLMVDPPVTVSYDDTQIRTRVLVTGGGSQTQVAIPASTSIVPIDDATLFSSGEAKTGTQRIAYTGKFSGGIATNVGSSIAAPSTAPTATLSATTVGSIVGVVSYKVSFKNASGETLPSAASNTVTGVAFSAPSGGPTAGAIVGLGRLVGTFQYKITNVTDRGETTPGPASSAVTATAFAAPTTPSVNISSGIGRLVGTYNYRETFLTAYGETDGGGIGARTAAAMAAPTSPSTAEASSTGGPLIGTYGYRVSFLSPYGETLPGAASTITVAAQTAPGAPSTTAAANIPGPLIGVYSWKVSFVSAIGETLGSASGNITVSVVTANSPTVSGDGTGVSIAYAVTYVHPVYGESALSARTVDTNKGANPVISVSGLPSGCGWNVYSSGVSSNPATDPLFKIAEMPVGASSFTHTTQTGPQEGVIATMGRYGTISSIPTGPTGTTARRVWRTKAGGSTYYLVGQIDNNTSTTLDDVTPDYSLTVTAPITNANGKTVTVSSIQVGPTGTLGRRVWRTKAGGTEYFLVGQLADNTTTTLTDATPDTALTQSAPIVATAGGEQHSVGVAIGPAGTLGRRIWRTEAGGTSTYRLLAEIPDNTTATFIDNVADTQLGGATVPVVNTAGGQNIQLTSILAGPTGTLARRIWRTKNGGTEYFFVGQISDNTTTSFVDSALDTDLRGAVPLVNDAGASAVVVTVPLGPAGITSRRLYRTEGGGSIWRFVQEIRDNTTTSIVDTKADTALGDIPLDVATIGALAGSTSLTVVSASAFPTAGWAEVDSQLISWTGHTATTLTGIPASGDGSLQSAVSAGSSVVTLPLLTGVTGITTALAQGDAINLLVQRDDTVAQAALAAREGRGDGIIEFPITDNTLSVTEAQARGDAELALFARPIATVKYTSRDTKTRSGKTIHIDLPSIAILGDFIIQSVTIDEIGIAGADLNPRYQAEASSVRFSLEDALRRLL